MYEMQMKMAIAKVVLVMFIIPTFPMAYGNHYIQVPLASGVGPESFAFDCNGEGPYTGVSDGRIFKWKGLSDPVSAEFAVTAPYRRRDLCDGSKNPQLEATCGRPLGLQFNKVTCEVYIADAYFGLMKVGINGGVATPLASSSQGIPFRFTNALDINQATGDVYFTDSSIWYQRWENIRVVQSGDSSGRLMKYDPSTRQVTVLAKGLAFANGVALSKYNTYVLVAETSKSRILRYWLQGPLASTIQVFAEVPGAPDNIRRNANGEFWVALNNGRTEPSYTSQVIGVRLDEDGRLLQALYGNGVMESISEVKEVNGLILIGSVITPYLAISTP